MPEPPNKNKILNHGLAPEKQMFRRQQYQLRNGIYIDACDIKLEHWKSFTEKEQTFISDEEWRKRFDGEWYWINDMPIFITGYHYFMLNYWHIQKRLMPDFRENNWALWHLIGHLRGRPDCFGLLIMKGRRKTVTTMVNCYTFDECTRYESQRAGMINKTKTDAYKNNLSRINLAMNLMPPFFNPIRRQNYPKENIEFMPPDEKTSAKQLREGIVRKEVGEVLHSTIMLGPTVSTAFDGDELTVFAADEPGKWKDQDPNDVWDVHKLALMDGGNKAGFGFMYSSVEEITEAQLAKIGHLWDSAKPEPGGEFISENWLARYAEPFHLGYDGKFKGMPCIDPFGFSRHELAIERRQRILAPLIKAKKSRAIANMKRKMPMDIDEMLSPSADKCSFNIEYLTAWHKILTNRIIENPSLGPVRGTFNGHPSTGDCRFMPRPDIDSNDFDHPEAQVYISSMPTQDERNNWRKTPTGIRLPGNPHLYSIGVDTFDHEIDPKTYGGRLSDGAFSVKRLFNLTADHALLDPETGLPPNEPGSKGYLGEGMWSNRVVCRYSFRDADPDAFAEKVFQAAVFYGAVVHVESTKPGRIRAYAKQHGLEGYLYFANPTAEAGWSGADKVQSAYFDLLSILVENYVRAQTDPAVLQTLMKMERKNMKKHDLGVAIGLSDLGGTIPYTPPPDPAKQKKIIVHRKRTYAYARR